MFTIKYTISLYWNVEIIYNIDNYNIGLFLVKPIPKREINFLDKSHLIRYASLLCGIVWLEIFLRQFLCLNL